MDSSAISWNDDDLRREVLESVAGLEGDSGPVEIHCFSEVDSTMDVAQRLGAPGPAIEGGSPAGTPMTVVFACSQTKARGRFGRTWVSPYGCGVYCSFAFKPCSSVGSALSLVAGLSVGGVLEEFGARIALKWPNDVYAETVAGELKKAAGILVETASEGPRWGTVVLGIGVNVKGGVHLAPFSATSLEDILGYTLSVASVFAALVRRVSRDVRVYLAEGFSSFEEEWNRLCLLRGRRVLVKDSRGIREGDCCGVGAEGALVVDFAEGLESLYAAEVSVADASCN